MNTRIILLSALLVPFAACEHKSAQPPPPPAPQPAPASSAAPVDWSKITPAGAEQSMDAMCRLARLADAWRSASKASIQLWFQSNTVTDQAGHSAAITPAEWKGILDMIDKAPGKLTAARALPAAAKDYADGLGSLPRNAYNVGRGEGDSVILTPVKPLGDNSKG